jgi:hypothetical protein
MKSSIYSTFSVFITLLLNTAYGQVYCSYQEAMHLDAKDSVIFIWLDSNDYNSTIDFSLFPNLEELSIRNWNSNYQVLDYSPTITRLDLYKCKGLASLNFSNFKNIKELSICFSEDVENLDFSIFNNLERLQISNNQLRVFPTNLTKLKTIKVLNIGESYGDASPMCMDDIYLQTQNKIVSLPESIGDLTELEDLDISFNPIKNLPESLKNLTKLKSIDISKTDIQEIPDFFINKSRKEYFYIRYYKGKENHFSSKTKRFLNKQKFAASSTVRCKKSGRYVRISKLIGD